MLCGLTCPSAPLQAGDCGACFHHYCERGFCSLRQSRGGFCTIVVPLASVTVLTHRPVHVRGTWLWDTLCLRTHRAQRVDTYVTSCVRVRVCSCAWPRWCWSAGPLCPAGNEWHQTTGRKQKEKGKTLEKKVDVKCLEKSQPFGQGLFTSAPLCLCTCALLVSTSLCLHPHCLGCPELPGLSRRPVRKLNRCYGPPFPPLVGGLPHLPGTPRTPADPLAADCAE